jgi:hypothetical protein
MSPAASTTNVLITKMKQNGNKKYISKDRRGSIRASAIEIGPRQGALPFAHERCADAEE